MSIVHLLQKAAGRFHRVVPFSAGEQLYPFDFTAANTALTTAMLADTDSFTGYITRQLQQSQCRYGIGGYNEHRTIYARSHHFDTTDEPRRLHLGTDIWSEAGTPVYAPLAGTIHSFQFNDHFGDYGATIILQHQLEDVQFHTLYGHLNLKSLQAIHENDPVAAGQPIGTFGTPQENGHWPPHLHFQIITDMEAMKGDYPGVCKFSERNSYLANCPDGDLILQMNQYIKR